MPAREKYTACDVMARNGSQSKAFFSGLYINSPNLHFLHHL